MKRILKSENILSGLLGKGDEFYVGLIYDDYVKSANLTRYDLPRAYSNQKFMPLPRGPVTRANVNGKYVRKEPEEKTTKTVEIKYTRKDGARIHYFRDFHVYVKVLQHQYKIHFEFAENVHGQKLLISPKLEFDGSIESNRKNTHVINLLLEIFSDFEIYTDSLEPAIAFNKKFAFQIVPKGSFDNEDLEDFVEQARRYLREETAKAFQKRLKVVQRYNPELKGRGPEGFMGYIVFGFPDKGLVVLESMYLDNATYIFDYDNYEEKIKRDKQYIIKNNLARYILRHDDKWEAKMDRLLG